MIEKSTLRALLLIVALIGSIRAQDEPQTSIQFSIHILSDAQHAGESNLKRIEGIYYSYNELSIPVQLKEGRQSILYPYLGPKKLTFYRPGDSGDETPNRIPLCSVEIPSGKSHAVFLLYLKDDNYNIRPFWFSRQDLRTPGFLTNLSMSTIGLQLGKKSRLQIHPGKTIPLRPSFSSDANHAYLYLEAFLSEDRNGTKRLHKCLETNLFFPKGTTQLNLLLSPSPRQVSVINLSALGIPNRTAQSELERFIPSLKKKEAPNSN